MSTPVEEIFDPFGSPPAMAGSPKQHDDHDNSKEATSGELTTPVDRLQPPKGKKRVGFSSGGDSAGPSGVGPFGDDNLTIGSSQNPSPNYGSPEVSGHNTPSQPYATTVHVDPLLNAASKSHLPELSQQHAEQIRGSLVKSLQLPRPRPAIRHAGPRIEEPLPDDALDGPDDDGGRATRRQRAQEAFERAKRLENDERVFSEPGTRNTSPERDHDVQGLEEDPTELSRLEKEREDAHEEALKLVRRHTEVHRTTQDQGYAAGVESGQQSGAVTPTEDQDFMEDYAPRPQHYRGGVLGTLLKLYNDPYQKPRQSGDCISRSGASTPQQLSPSDSGATTPVNARSASGTATPVSGKSRWYSREQKGQSISSLAHLVGSSTSIATPGSTGFGEQVNQKLREHQARQKRPGLGKRTRSGGTIFNRFGKLHEEERYRITKHIAETISRQKYLMKLCMALMEYGAPTHRMEEYMRMSARVLETDAQFLYIPGAMIMSFEDRDTHTSEVKLVRAAQGVDLGKLRDVHEVYKEVVHDKIGVEDATKRLKEITTRKAKHNRLVRIPMYGLAAVSVGPFAFGARLIDLPISFVLGSILGILQLYVAPQSELYANVFEISAAVITSFLARAFGSIRGGDLFCFSALAQSSIALILPGYTVLCASLELQSRSIVAGSVRMVYAIIYSLFLGFGITVGTAIYGMIDSNATSETTCKEPISEPWFFFFVPAFTMCLIIINQAKWKQAPMMMFIAFAGYIVSYFSSRRFSGNTQISNTLGALVIGVIANSYSRVGGKIENFWLDLWENRLRPRWKSFRKHVFGVQSRKQSAKAMEAGRLAGDNESIFVPAARRVGYSLAAAAMLPAIFVQVPSGLSVNGSLVSGIASANQITGNATNGTQVVSTSSLTDTSGLNSIAFTVGYSVIQVAIGITVGLFLSAIVVYPFGKRRSGLFSF